MADPNFEDIESNWVFVSDTIDVGEEAFESDTAEKQDSHETDSSKFKEKSSDNSETDSIGVLSETSSFQECGDSDEEVIIAHKKIPWKFCEYVGPNTTKLDNDNYAATSNRFYLNCLQEPVQELSENESEVDRNYFENDNLLEEMSDINEAADMKLALPEIKFDFDTANSPEIEHRSDDSDDGCEINEQEEVLESKSGYSTSSDPSKLDLSVNEIESDSLLYDESYENLKYLLNCNTEILSSEQNSAEHQTEHGLVEVHQVEERYMYVANQTRDDPEQDRPCNLIKKYINGILVGTVLLALSSIYLGQYLNVPESMEDDLPIYQEDFKEDLKDSFEALPVIQKSYDVPTALKYCSDKHESDDLYKEINVKKCLNKIDRRIQRAKEREKLLNKELYLEVKEKYLEEREKNLLKREFEVLKSELKLHREKSLKQAKKDKDESEYAAEGGNTENIRSKNKKDFYRSSDKFKNRNEINKKHDKPAKYYYTKSEEYNENKKLYKSKPNNDGVEEKKKGKDGMKRRKNMGTYSDKLNKYSMNESKKLDTKYRNNYNKNYRRYKFEKSKRLAFDEEAKWYFDWMKGREVLRYIESYYSSV